MYVRYHNMHKGFDNNNKNDDDDNDDDYDDDINDNSFSTNKKCI